MKYHAIQYIPILHYTCVHVAVIAARIYRTEMKMKFMYVST